MAVAVIGDVALPPWLVPPLALLVTLALVVAAAAAVGAAIGWRQRQVLTRAASAPCGGPFICPFPPAAEHPGGARWRCPSCRTAYVLTRQPPQPLSGHGYWRLSWRQGGAG